eukprot:233806_1
MSTKSEGNGSSGDLPGRQSSKVKLDIQMLKRGGDDLSNKGNMWFNLFLCFIALMILYAWYAFFGWVWLTAMTELGEDLNWAFFGTFVAVGGGMAGGVAYSMKAQRIGWWTPLTKDEARSERDARGKCCGFQVY